MAAVNGQRGRYVVSHMVTVHYNRADPREAVLETPFPVVETFGIIVGVVFAFAGWNAYQRRRRARHAGDFDDDA
jgi:hypothetical protein